MSALSAAFIFSVFILIKFSSPVNDLLDSKRAFGYDNLYRFWIAESVAGNQGVFNVFFVTVIVKISYAGYAALGIFCIRFVSNRFCNNEHLTFRIGLGNLQCISKPGNTRSDNKK